METIYQYWFNRYNNIGDLLGPWIVQKLAPHCEVRYASYVTKMEAFRIVVGALLHFRMPAREYWDRLFISQPILFAIGSILDHCNEHVVVWGAGFQNEGETCGPGKFLAVRGPETKNRLKEIGYPIAETIALGDPALLMPELYNPRVEKKHSVAIVMHLSDKEYISEHFRDYHLIDVETEGVEPFIDDLCSCEKVLTTSMHGLILAHAYGIPALWMRQNWIGSDGFKFKDYFGSVGLPYMAPLAASEVEKMDREDVLNLFADESTTLPRAEVLHHLRKGLLSSFPFR